MQEEWPERSAAFSQCLWARIRYSWLCHLLKVFDLVPWRCCMCPRTVLRRWGGRGGRWALCLGRQASGAVGYLIFASLHHLRTISSLNLNHTFNTHHLRTFKMSSTPGPTLEFYYDVTPPPSIPSTSQLTPPTPDILPVRLHSLNPHHRPRSPHQRPTNLASRPARRNLPRHQRAPRSRRLGL